MKRTINATYFALLVVCCLLVGVVTVSGVHAQDSEAKTNKWQFEITPYFFSCGHEW